MTDVRQVDLSDVALRTDRNAVAPAGRLGLLRRLPGGKRQIVGTLGMARTGIRWRPLLSLLAYLSPTLLTGLYFGLIASDRYVSTASFIVRTASKPSGTSGLGTFLRMAGLARSDDDTYSVQNFILSRNAVQQLQDKLPLAEMYARPGADFAARYPSLIYGRTREELFKYYLRMTSVVNDTTTGITTLEVQAFRPDDAQAIATSLLDFSENLVNALNQRIHGDAMSAAQQDVSQDEERLTQAQIALTTFQNKETMIDPTTNSALNATLVGKLEIDLAQTQARIADMKAGSPNNPGLVQLLRQAEVTRAQIDHERSQVTTSEQGLADKLGRYERLVLDREFATKALAVANTALDSARQEVRRKQLYIERIVEPNLSDHATMPYRVWSVFTVFMCNMLGALIVWIVSSGVREHASSAR